MPSYEWTQVAYWKTPHLSYTLFLALSILGGIIGLDHLYLRSPVTAFLKIASFFVLPFFWYLYDILQVTAEKKLFMKFGLITPFVTTAGIGAGMFRDSTEPVKDPLPEDKTPPSPFWFMGFVALSLLPLGLDHFLVGDNNGGLVKILLMLIPIIGLIYTSVWTIYSLFRIFFKTETLFSHGISRFVTPKMEEYFFAGGRLGIAAAKPVEPKKMSFMDLIKVIWADIKKFFIGGDDEKEKEVETHGLVDTAIQQGLRFVYDQKDRIIARSPMAQKIVAGVEMANEVVQGPIGESVKAGIETAGAVKNLITTAPAEAAKATGIIQQGLEDKLSKLPSPVEMAKAKAMSHIPAVPTIPSPIDMAKEKAASLVPSLNQSGGGIVSDNSTAILALVAMFAIVASFSLGKYMFVKFHGTEEQKAYSEKPPTRSEFVNAPTELSDMPPVVA